MTAALLHIIETQLNAKQEELEKTETQIFELECSDDYCYTNGRINPLLAKRRDLEQDIKDLQETLNN